MESNARPSPSMNVQSLPIDCILPDVDPFRRSVSREQIASLADSIRQFGILQPLCVRKIADNPPQYTLIAGERRFRAAKLLGLLSVPCVILRTDGAQSAAITILENLQRRELTMFEQAAACAALIREHSLTQEEIARQLGVSQSYIANKLRLLRFADEEQALILDAGLSERHARALLRLHGTQRLCALRHIIATRKNVADTEAYIEHLVRGESLAPVPLDARDVRRFCTSVRIALERMRESGVNAEAEEHNENGTTEIRIRIPNSNVSRETFSFSPDETDKQGSNANREETPIL